VGSDLTILKKQKQEQRREKEEIERQIKRKNVKVTKHHAIKTYWGVET
jgi:hypothetical protein